MEKFKDYKYERPDLKKIEEEFDTLLKKFNEADNAEVQSEIIREINKIRNHFDTMATLVSIRHSIDTEDEFYMKETDFIDENGPIYQNLVSEYYKVLVNSKFMPWLARPQRQVPGQPTQRRAPRPSSGSGRSTGSAHSAIAARRARDEEGRKG